MSFLDHRSTVSTVRAADSDAELASPPFPHTPDPSFFGPMGGRCFCGNSLDSKRMSGTFCSICGCVNWPVLTADCARNGTFTSLTHNRQPSITGTQSMGHLSDPLAIQHDSRAASAASDYEEPPPHPRAMARADQRREERRRRRADPIECPSPLLARSSTLPNMTGNIPTTSPTWVPDLVSSHSRNTSTASSVFSLASTAGLSRTGSTCSSLHARHPSVAVGAAIMEVDGEDPAESNLARSTLKARSRRRHQPGPSRSLASSTSSSSSDMRVHDMLDELINMEQSFRVHEEAAAMAQPEREPSPVFTPLLDRPPRTPSPVNVAPVLPPAPGGERRGSHSQPRPSSQFTAHQTSLSESHTALYLATASPLKTSTSSDRVRRSASPELSLRRSIVFTPSLAGPILPPSPPSHADSPATPSRRKNAILQNSISGWRFPKPGFETPTRSDFGMADDIDDDFEPACLWPEDNNSLGPSALTATRSTMNLRDLTGSTRTPPRSGIRLGMLLGSSIDEDVDVDMESEFSDDRSTVRGSIRHSFVAPSPPFAQRG